jgi:hypothetical protein
MIERKPRRLWGPIRLLTERACGIVLHIDAQSRRPVLVEYRRRRARRQRRRSGNGRSRRNPVTPMPRGEGPLTTPKLTLSVGTKILSISRAALRLPPSYSFTILHATRISMF